MKKNLPILFSFILYKIKLNAIQKLKTKINDLKSDKFYLEFYIHFLFYKKKNLRNHLQIQSNHHHLFQFLSYLFEFVVLLTSYKIKCN